MNTNSLNHHQTVPNNAALGAIETPSRRDSLQQCRGQSDAFRAWVTHRRAPPWVEITSRDLARVLGISIQTLANWRVREKGPPYEGSKRGRGNKIFYVPCMVYEWMVEDPVAHLRLSNEWLAVYGLALPETARPDEIVAHIEWLRRIDVFSSFR